MSISSVCCLRMICLRCGIDVEQHQEDVPADKRQRRNTGVLHFVQDDGFERRVIACILLGFPSALDYVEGESGEGRFFVAGLHVETGLVHGGDDLVEGELVVSGFMHGHAGGVDGFDGAHAIALDAWDLDEAADGVAGHSQIVLHGDLGGVFDLGVGAVEGGNQASGGHAAGYADFTLAADFGS
jgi:hypothetical protein